MQSSNDNRVASIAPAAKPQRKAYASPKLTAHGDVRSLTQAAPVGGGNGGCGSQLRATS
jgi:hypothetical protein